MLVRLGSGSKKPRHFEERDYFLDENGVFCSWTLNGKPQPIDDYTVESVKSYLAGVL